MYTTASTTPLTVGRIEFAPSANRVHAIGSTIFVPGYEAGVPGGAPDTLLGRCITQSRGDRDALHVVLCLAADQIAARLATARDAIAVAKKCHPSNAHMLRQAAGQLLLLVRENARDLRRARRAYRASGAA